MPYQIIKYWGTQLNRNFSWWSHSPDYVHRTVDNSTESSRAVCGANSKPSQPEIKAETFIKLLVYNHDLSERYFALNLVLW